MSDAVRSMRLRRVGMLVLALVLLAACLPQPYYEETPTAPVSVPVAAPTISAATPMPAPTETPVITGPATVRMDPSVILDLAVGETRRIEIWVDNVEYLHAIELHIGFEPRYVGVQDADPDTEGVQIATGNVPAPVEVIRNDVSHEAGVIVYHVAQEPGSSARGSGLVASFTVGGRSEGGSPLRFNIVRLLDSQGESLPMPDQVDALISVVASEGEPEPTSTPDTAPPEPTATPEGTIPDIDEPVAATPSSQEGSVYHIVQAGENVYRIALKYGTTVEAIAAANGLADPGSVRVGQRLLIPVGAAASTVYVVQPGDTLYSIARRHGTTVEALAALNGLAPPYTIKVGQTLTVP